MRRSEGLTGWKFEKAGKRVQTIVVKLPDNTAALPSRTYTEHGQLLFQQYLFLTPSCERHSAVITRFAQWVLV